MIQNEISFRVRYAEVDRMGYVHHGNYAAYFEMGRTELLRASGGRYRDMEETGLLVVVVRVDCRYKSPARYDDLIEIETRIAKVTAAKIIHEYTVRRDEVTVATATVTLAVINRDGQLQRVPKFLLDQYGES